VLFRSGTPSPWARGLVQCPRRTRRSHLRIGRIGRFWHATASADAIVSIAGLLSTTTPVSGKTIPRPHASPPPRRTSRSQGSSAPSRHPRHRTAFSPCGAPVHHRIGSPYRLFSGAPGVRARRSSVREAGRRAGGTVDPWSTTACEQSGAQLPADMVGSRTPRCWTDRSTRCGSRRVSGKATCQAQSIGLASSIDRLRLMVVGLSRAEGAWNLAFTLAARGQQNGLNKHPGGAGWALGSKS